MRHAVAKRIAFEIFMAPAETETFFSPAEARVLPVPGRDHRANKRIADRSFHQALSHGEGRFVTPLGMLGKGMLAQKRRVMICVRRTAGTADSCPTW